ncbi:MAG: hypothetical protein RL757_2100 [Bacteroidota bacterium]|jgi:FKBP-type peptidyl-prolyl cis-trans isomerase
MKNLGKLFLPTLAAVSMLASCAQKSKNGDYVLCNVKVTCDSEVMMDTNDEGCPEPTILPVHGKEKLDSMGNTGIPRFLAEALLDVKKGDIKTIEMLTDTMKQKPCDGKKITYTIEIVEVVNKKKLDEINEKRRGQMATMQDVMRANGEKIQATLKAAANDSAAVVGRLKSVSDMMTKYAADYTSGALKSQIKTTKSGLEYIIIEEGKGAKPAGGNVVSVQYYGCLTNGSMFDASFKRGQPFAFALPLRKGEQPQVIQGWDEAVRLLPEGSTALVIIPAKLGYGPEEKKDEKGKVSIPANSTLMFYMNLQNRFDYQPCPNTLKPTETKIGGEPTNPRNSAEPREPTQPNDGKK